MINKKKLIASLLAITLILTGCSKEEDHAEDQHLDNAGRPHASAEDAEKGNHEIEHHRHAEGEEHFHGPALYERESLGEKDIIGTSVKDILKGKRQTAAVQYEGYDFEGTVNNPNPRFGWTPEQWTHVRDKRYDQLGKEISENTNFELFEAFRDFQITTGGGIVDGQFVGDPDDAEQIKLMIRDAKTIDFTHPDYQEAIKIFDDWKFIGDLETLDRFKTKYRPRAFRDNRAYSIPGEYSTTIIDNTYLPFKTFIGLKNVRLNHNLIVGGIRTEVGDRMEFILVKEDGQWKMMGDL